MALPECQNEGGRDMNILIFGFPIHNELSSGPSVERAPHITDATWTAVQWLKKSAIRVFRRPKYVRYTNTISALIHKEKINKSYFLEDNLFLL